MKDKYYIIATVLVIVLAVGAIVYKNRGKESGLDVFGSDTEDKIELEGEENSNNGNDLGNNTAGPGDFIEGVLNNSDSQERGNLKLMSNLGEIYIRTTKDFNALIGSRVLIMIDGTLENFKLVDIQAKLENNGFINAQ